MQGHLSCILSDTFINDFKVLVTKNIKQGLQYPLEQWYMDGIYLM